MTENKHYLVSYSTGSYDDFRINNLFVTENEEYAKKYCEKFNRILNKWRPYFLEVYNNYDWENDENNDSHYDKSEVFIEINQCFYNEIEMR